MSQKDFCNPCRPQQRGRIIIGYNSVPLVAKEANDHILLFVCLSGASCGSYEPFWLLVCHFNASQSLNKGLWAIFSEFLFSLGLLQWAVGSTGLSGGKNSSFKWAFMIISVLSISGWWNTEHIKHQIKITVHSSQAKVNVLSLNRVGE